MEHITRIIQKGLLGKGSVWSECLCGWRSASVRIISCAKEKDSIAIAMEYAKVHKEDLRNT